MNSLGMATKCHSLLPWRHKVTWYLSEKSWHYPEVYTIQVEDTTTVTKGEIGPQFRRHGPRIRQGAWNEDNETTSDPPICNDGPGMSQPALTINNRDKMRPTEFCGEDPWIKQRVLTKGHQEEIWPADIAVMVHEHGKAPEVGQWRRNLAPRISQWWKVNNAGASGKCKEENLNDCPSFRIWLIFSGTFAVCKGNGIWEL